MSILAYNIAMLVLDGVAIWAVRRVGRSHSVMALCAAGMALATLSLAGIAVTTSYPFDIAQMMAWAVFLHYPLWLAGSGFVMFRNSRPWALLSLALAAGLILVAADAFLIEPKLLALDRIAIPTDRDASPLRIAVIADLQAAAPGAFEARALGIAMQTRPDVILFIGDYVHIGDRTRYKEAVGALNAIVRQANLSAPLGVFALAGNVDDPSLWVGVFEGTPVRVVATTTTVDIGPAVLTLLGLHDSEDSSLSVHAESKLHIVAGHSPNFSLGAVEADVLLAGHTHGGQVRIPFVGPLLTLSQVPRAWASGVTRIAPGKTLVVSRGIGLERGDAPRMRFLCPPEVVLLELGGSAGAGL